MKVWDLERQCCIGTVGDQSMNKVNDFVLIGELGLLVTGSVDNNLRVFKVSLADGENPEEGAFTLTLSSTFSKESTARVIQMAYERKNKMLIVLNSDNKLEMFKVNVDKPETIMKKLIRQEKKRSLKRNHSQMDEADNEEPLQKSVDKD